jgi:regulator of sigma E protease
MYVIFAILGLSFLIFIHELGHYLMAKKVGMRVETFAIGFGRPIFSWIYNNEKWQIGWLLFGGYVKIAGTETDKGQDPYAVKDGFFGKSPWDRIKVAFMGPFVNLVFAFGVFALLYFLGGQEKNFAEYTKKIGAVDPKSEIYSQGIRPGDEITSYNEQPYESSKDHLYAPMTANSTEMDVKGYKVNYATGEKTPFNISIRPYQHPNSLEKGVMTTGILNSASYVKYDKYPDGSLNELPKGSPLQESGIEYGDQIVAVDGERIFSLSQVNAILNEGRALLTVQRGDEIKQLRVPRVLVEELRMDKNFKEELTDWQFEAGLNGKKLQNLYMIPFNLTDNCVVENQIKFIDPENEAEAFPKHPFSNREEALKAGDKIIAIDGLSVTRSSDLFEKLQENRLTVIVQRNLRENKNISWEQADKQFETQVDMAALEQIVNSIGTKQPIKHVGNLYLLNPIVPKPRSEFDLSLETKQLMATQVTEQRKAIDSIEDPEKRSHAIKLLEAYEKQLLLGLPNVQDARVNYNPGPVALFSTVFSEIGRTLKALFTGALNPKWISGPIGIVQVVHDSWSLGVKQALFWLGAISLNLGLLNLLPIPMLDGGTIAISFIELITGRALHPKTLEKIIFPFAIILIGFFIFLTYNDLSRLLSGFFK